MTAHRTAARTWLVTTAVALAAATAVVATSGCAQQQLAAPMRHERATISPGGHNMGLSVLTRTSDPARQPVIDAARSHATHAGRRYALRVVPSTYRPFVTPWMNASLYLLTPDRDALDAGHWDNGDWDLHIAFTDERPEPDIDLSFRLRTVITSGTLFWPSP